MTKDKNQTFPVTFIFMYALIYMINASFMPYLPLYFKSIGFDSGTTGFLLSIGPVLAILTQPLWGFLSDRAGSKTRVFRLMLAGVCLVTMLFPLSTQLAYLTALMIVYYFFQSSIAPISDTIALEYLEGTPWQFGPIRMSGSIGYALLTVVAGYLVHFKTSMIFVITSAVALLALLNSYRMPDIKGHQRDQKRVMPWVLFKNKTVMGLILFSFAIQISAGYYYSFYSIYLQELGAGTPVIGLAMLIAALSEIPFLLFADRIIQRLGIRMILCVSALITALRFVLFWQINDLWTAVFINILHGFSYIVFIFSLAVFINKQVPDKLKASGQTLQVVIGQGISKFVGSTLGGLLTDKTDVATTFLVIGILSFIATGVFFFVSAGRSSQIEPFSKA